MVFTTEAIDEGTGILWTAFGVVTGHDLIEEASSPAPRFPSHRTFTHALVDLTHADGLQVSAAEIREFAEICRQNAQAFGPIFVVIAAPGDLAFGLARMYHAMAHTTGWTINIFRSLVKAKAWLDSVRPAEASTG